MTQVVKLISPEETSSNPSNSLGKLIPFFSFKGGVGKSVFATNFSLELAQTFPLKKVALVDFNLYNPDIATMLKVDIDRKRVLKNYFTNRNTELSEVVHKYSRIENIDLFLSDYDLHWLDEVNEDMIKDFLNALKTEYDYIIIDTHPALDLITTFLPMLYSDNLICVTTPEIPSLRNSDQQRIEYLRSLGIESEIFMILTRYNVSPNINLDMVKQETGISDIVCIHEKPSLIVDSINKGEPFVLNTSKNKSIQKIKEELQTIIPFITGIDLKAIKERLTNK